MQSITVIGLVHTIVTICYKNGRFGLIIGLCQITKRGMENRSSVFVPVTLSFIQRNDLY